MTTSIELSKKLHEAGLKIETEKWWCDKFPFVCSEPIIIDLKTKERWRTSGNGGGALSFEQPAIDALMSNISPAYQTDELLAVMPYKINNICYLVVCKAFSDYIIRYFDYEKIEIVKIQNKSLPEALGKMCLWLLSNGYCYDPGNKKIAEAK